VASDEIETEGSGKKEKVPVARHPVYQTPLETEVEILWTKP
jgi:hypothetical protein